MRAIMIIGPGSRYYNNYFYGSREGGFTVELGWTGTLDGFTTELGNVEARGNVFDKCDAGIGLGWFRGCKSQWSEAYQ